MTNYNNTTGTSAYSAALQLDNQAAIAGELPVPDEANSFLQDVNDGLSAPAKHLSSKYFYDDLGSQIFQDIMGMPAYYPTPCEFEILAMQSDKIIEMLNFDSVFNVIEFGAGDGLKTRQLLKKLIENNIDFQYVPIDISAKAIEELLQSMWLHLPALQVKPMIGNYFSMMEQLSASETPSLFLFLGSNIGNYQDRDADHLMTQFHQTMKFGDKLLTGFDLQKHPSVISQAYNDPQGITKAFNLNLLVRINRELGANFQINQFDFYSYYNPVNGEVRSYLVSLKSQQVYIEKLRKSFSFNQNELIWTELSKKYTLQEIEEMAHRNHFGVVRHFLDCKHYFADSLWAK
jgi:L-histidine N-alpha-methyltransferase